jgi:hypothetical protein
MKIKHLYRPLFYNLVTKKIAGHEALLCGTNNEGSEEVLFRLEGSVVAK